MLPSVRSCGTLAGVVAAVASAVFLSSAALAQARVTAPRPVSPRGLLVQQSAVGAGGGRTAVLMAGYARRRSRSVFSLQARLGDATGFGRVQRLAGGADFPQVAVGADGTAVAAWFARAPGVLRVAVARPGHNFGRVQTLSRARSMLGGVGVTATGRAVVAWRPGTSETPVRVAVAEPGRRFGAAQTLGVSRNYAPAVTVAPNGTVIVAWLDTPSPPLPPPAPPPATSTARVLAATLAQGAASFGAAIELGTLGFWFSGPEAASGPGGAAVSWRQTGTEKLLVSLAPGDAFEPAVSLPPASHISGIGLPDHLALSIPAGGTSVALWLQAHTRTAESDTLTSAVVNSSSRSSGGAFSPPRRLSASGWLAGVPRATTLPDRTVAAWGEIRGRRSRVRLAVRPLGRDWMALTPLPARSLNSLTLDVAASSRYAVITWIQDVGTSRRSLGAGRMYLTTYRR